MARNKMNDLRDHLFIALERLNDDSIMNDPEVIKKEIDRANAISNIAKEITLSAKVEVDFLKVTGTKNSNSNLFLALEGGEPQD